MSAFNVFDESRVTVDMKVIKTQSESNPSYFPKVIFWQKD